MHELACLVMGTIFLVLLAVCVRVRPCVCVCAHVCVSVRMYVCFHHNHFGSQCSSTSALLKN